MRAEEHAALGDLTVTAYRSLEGAPTLEEGRPYYDDLRDVARRASSDKNVIVVACDASSGALLGGFDIRGGRIRTPVGGRPPPASGCWRSTAQLRVEGSARRSFVTPWIAPRVAGKPVVLLHTAQVMQAAAAPLRSARVLPLRGDGHLLHENRPHGVPARAGLTRSIRRGSLFRAVFLWATWWAGEISRP